MDLNARVNVNCGQRDGQTDRQKMGHLYRTLLKQTIKSKHDLNFMNTVITLNIGTPRPATAVVLNIKQFNFTLK